MKKITLVLFVFMAATASAQDGYKLDFNFDDLSDTTIFLGSYFYGGSTFIKDTARVDKQGSVSFESHKPLPAGMYFLVLERSKVFDFIVGDNKRFNIQSSLQNPYKNPKTSDRENNLFFQSLQFNATKHKEAQPFIEVFSDSTQSVEAIEKARAEFNKIDKEVLAWKTKLVADNKGTYLAKLVDVQIPIVDRLDPAKVESDPDYAFEFYKEHFWDNLDLGDGFYTRLAEPVYKNKLLKYFETLVSPHADSVVKQIDWLAVKAKRSLDTYKFFVWTLVLEYQEPKYMGQDAVFIHLNDAFFASGEMDFWANAQLKKNVNDRAQQLKKSMIGAPAPELKMQDENLEAQSLLAIPNQYTVVYFYDPDCGHCKTETPILKKFMDTSTFDVQVYAVSADTSMQKMRDYIQEMGLEQWVTVNGPRTYVGNYQQIYDATRTPTIYVLNEKKKIIAKKLDADQLEDFLMKYEAIESKKTTD